MRCLRGRRQRPPHRRGPRRADSRGLRRQRGRDFFQVMAEQGWKPACCDVTRSRQNGVSPTIASTRSPESVRARSATTPDVLAYTCSTPRLPRECTVMWRCQTRRPRRTDLHENKTRSAARSSSARGSTSTRRSTSCSGCGPRTAAMLGIAADGSTGLKMGRERPRRRGRTNVSRQASSDPKSAPRRSARSIACSCRGTAWREYRLEPATSSSRAERCTDGDARQSGVHRPDLAYVIRDRKIVWRFSFYHEDGVRTNRFSSSTR